MGSIAATAVRRRRLLGNNQFVVGLDGLAGLANFDTFLQCGCLFRAKLPTHGGLLGMDWLSDGMRKERGHEKKENSIPHRHFEVIL